MSITNDTRSPDEIERDIVRTQDEMSRTVDRLGDRFTMRNLVDSIFEKSDMDEVEARRVYDKARRNPLALGLISAGAIWLISDHDAHPRNLKSSDSDFDDDDTYGLDTSYERDHRSYVAHMNTVERRDNEDDALYQRRRDDARAAFLMLERRHEEDDKSFRERLDDATDKLRQKRDEMAAEARQKRDEWREQARRKREELGEQARQGRNGAMSSARDARQQASAKSRQAAQRVSSMYEQNPLIGGAIAALVGLVAGSAAPATRKERELVGDHAESTLETAKHKAQDAAQKAREKKDEMVEKADRKVAPDSGESRSTSAGTDRSERVPLHN